MQQWLRTLFPSWRLFERTGEVALLFYRTTETDDHFGPWQQRMPRLANNNFLAKFFFNPTATKEHAIQNLLFHFLYDLEKKNEKLSIESLQTYQLIQEVLKSELDQNSTCYQFQIRSFNQKNNEESILVESAVHEI